MEFYKPQDAVAKRRQTPSIAAEKRRKPPQTTQYSFINSNVSGDAPTPDSIRQIRSHVARDIHARARQKRIDNLRVRSLPPRPSDFPQRHSAGPAEVVTKMRGHVSQADPVEKRPLGEKDRVVMPAALLQYPVSNGQVFARDITRSERYMLSTFMIYTENYKNAMQRSVKHSSVSTENLRQRWIPYCMSQEGLLETLFLKAGNALSELRGNSEERWDLVACRYRERCLKKAIEALARENMCPSDNTIALVISVGADDVSIL
ncbi:hypothetical protein M406DRAFT_330764 [Cryphonectria parasitica EP155]|uniref:Uncharacterized protein n=1 Tax=Cryphonectria parasitica (strain ATCC 38755 / EP155) TaxID=660469 RepID=A0A9P4Y0S7_CRYP1|nr:uncharacterized protein M406DRAFT_330764 [Cryphonectria parasitica EP155]KAF3764423.1 hypothetical protein M406DRAFT_330764 [Cryphonectria parasitica EP155]